MTRVLFRCDASASIGSGHIFRCRALARDLQARNVQVIFICRKQNNDLIKILESEFLVLSLPELPLTSVLDCNGSPLCGRDLYAAWLGCDQETDANQTLSILLKFGIGFCDWLVVDHYGLDSVWEAYVLQGLMSVYSFSTKLLVIDDLADRPHVASILLDQNYFGCLRSSRYESLVPTTCRQLTGPIFALLGPEYARLRSFIPNRSDIRRILVFFGGIDKYNCSIKVLEALSHPLFDHISVDIVLGSQSSEYNKVQSLVDKRPNTNLLFSLPSLSGLMLRADLFIGAGGSTTWERCCLELPSIVFTIADNQVQFTKALHDDGYTEYLGCASESTVELIRNVLIRRIDSSCKYFQRFNLCDGLGVQRVSAAMLGLSSDVILRAIQSSDQSILLHWFFRFSGSSDLNILSSLYDDSIASTFRTPLDSLSNAFRILTDYFGCPFGIVKFETSFNPSHVRVELYIDHSILPDFSESFLVTRIFALIDSIWSEPLRYSSFSSQSIPLAYANDVDEDTLAYVGKPLRITLLSDHDSWLNDYLHKLIFSLWSRGCILRWIHNPKDLVSGDVCFLVGCGRLLKSSQLSLHEHNLVVHESALPEGQGWSPMTWQILNGQRSIPITLFEAVSDLDSGPIYLRSCIELNGTELVDEWRILQAHSTIDLCLEWLDNENLDLNSTAAQVGMSSHYSRRRPSDSVLDPHQSIVDQFNLLRVVDNQRYPAHFYLHGRRYDLKILPSALDDS